MVWFPQNLKSKRIDKTKKKKKKIKNKNLRKYMFIGNSRFSIKHHHQRWGPTNIIIIFVNTYIKINKHTKNFQNFIFFKTLKNFTTDFRFAN